MTEDDILSSVSDAVMAGRAVDWDSCEAACTPNTRALVRELRAVAGIAQTHRAAAGPAGQSFSERKRVVSARERWGSLELIAIVGRGASGLVYRAWDTRLDREVALKLLHTDNSSTASPVVAEGRLLARVRHPNVIAVYGADHIDGRTGVWMEFVNGRTLEEIVRDEGPQDIAEVLEVGTALCRGLHAVHEAGLLHRDVTTRNVMRDPSGRIVLMDLHTGQETGGHGHPELVGTPLFLAPEVLIGGQTASVRSDVYSAGVVLYRLLTGAYPVEGSTLEQLREAWIEGEVGPVRSRRADLPAGLATAVEQALRRDPVHRTTSAAVLAGQLEALSSPREDAGRGISKPFIALASSLLLCGGALVHLARDVTPPPSSTTLRISGSGVSAERSTRPLNMEELQWGDFIATAPPSSDGRLIPGLRQGLRPAVRDLLTGGVQLLEPDHGTDSGAGAVVLSPDGRLAAYTWYPEAGPGIELRIAPLANGTPRVVWTTRSFSNVRLAAWLPAHPQFIAYLGHAGGDGELATIDLPSGSLRTIAPVRGEPAGMSLAPDRSRLAFDVPVSADLKSRDVFVADLSTGRVRELAGGPANDLFPSWAPDGRRVVFASDRGGSLGLWSTDVADGVASLPQLIRGSMGRFSPFAFGPEGDLYFLIQNSALDVYRLQLDQAGTVTSSPGRVPDPFIGQNVDGDWSPDGRSVVYVSRPGEVPFHRASMQLVIRDIASGQERRFTLPVDGISEPRWSPDGSRIAFRGRTGHMSRLYLLQLPGGTVTQVSPPVTAGPTLVWSPDGKRIYTSVPSEPAFAICVRDLATGEDLTIASPANGMFAISHDERWIATSRSEDWTGRVLLRQIDGGEWREVFRGTPGDLVLVAAWTPDDQALLVTRRPNPASGSSSSVTELWRITMLASGAATSMRVGEIKDLTAPRKFRIRRDGREILFTAGSPTYTTWVMRGIR